MPIREGDATQPDQYGSLAPESPAVRPGDERVELDVLRPPAFAHAARRPKLFIATPMYGAVCTMAYALGLSALVPALAQLGVQSETWVRGGESLITRARNMAVADFMKSDASHLLFIDADVGFRPDDVACLLAAEEDVVCGAYPMKRINWRAVEKAVRDGDPYESLARAAASYPINLFPEDLDAGKMRAVRRHGRTYVQVQDAATGFLLIRREVIARIITDFGPWLEYTTDYEPLGEVHHRLFDCGEDPTSMRQATLHRLADAAVRGGHDELQARAAEYAAAQQAQPGRYLSEDYYFSRLVQLVGSHVWMCLDCELTHMGNYVFHGNLEKVVPFRGGSREGAVKAR